MAVASSGRVPSRRIEGLDGVRGVAALIVVVHHCMLLTPALVEPYRAPRGTSLGPVGWAFTYTPLHLLWDGPVAVFVFFVLSGFVLTSPFRDAPRNWAAYYPPRLVRLYLPVWAAVVLAVLWEVVLPRPQVGSSWVQGHGPLTIRGVVQDLVLVVGAPGATSSALWSLRWEVIFSLALPLFIAFAVLLRRFAPVKLALLCAAVLLGAGFGPVDAAYRLPAAFQLPIFGIGCLLAVEWERLRDRLRGLLRTRWRRAGAAGVAVLLLTGYWIVCGFTQGSNPVWLLAVMRLLQVVGAASVIALCAAIPAWGRVLGSPVPRWLGTRSFSLYLVHEPIVTALGRLLPAPVSPLVSLAIAVPVALALTEVFFRAVERPSHRLSRWTAGRVRSLQGAPATMAVDR